MFTNDAFLWYNVGEQWKDMGLAVPNWSDDTHSQNGTIRSLTEMMGRNLQVLMFHNDARLRTPPSINTLTRIHKLCTRARDILSSRAVPSNEYNMESVHAQPSPEVFKVYPTPYFTVQNQWMKEYAGLILTAITECFQHTENTRPNEISEVFSGVVGQYIHRVYRLMAVELFKKPLTEAKEPTFTLTEEDLRSYNPTAWFTSTEMNDTVVSPFKIPTEDDLKVISQGIPVVHLPNLTRWPSSDIGIGGPDTKANSSKSAFTTPIGA